jgi:hypothetical protein
MPAHFGSPEVVIHLGVVEVRDALAHGRIYQSTSASAVSEYGLPRNPVAGIEDIDTSTHFTYTEDVSAGARAFPRPIWKSSS